MISFSSLLTKLLPTKAVVELNMLALEASLEWRVECENFQNFPRASELPSRLFLASAYEAVMMIL